MKDLHEFKKYLDEVYKELSHHNIQNTIEFVIRNEDGEDEYFELDDKQYFAGVEYDRLFGCACCVGAIVNLKRVKNES